MRLSEHISIVASLQFGLSGLFDCHVYAIQGNDGVVLVDSGAGNSVEPLLKNVAREFPGQAIVALLLTHAHLDHCGGASQIREISECKVIASARCRKLLESADEEAIGLTRAREQGVYPPDFEFHRCPVDQEVHDGETFLAAGIPFSVLQVRGHSPDAVCYSAQIDSSKCLFVGDTVFYGGVLGVINADGSGMEGYREDLPKLAGLDIDGLFPGHGMFTLRGGQRHIDCALQQLQNGFLGRQIGQGDLLF